ncbi:hypothetical protein [Pallidibacillus thermolactis]|jgi:uncharacterized protein|uniref:hypothetical protein n=1 Tax=Pallidibacillus thermolactis TaxID=251051 RepID=UPI0021DA1B45|nr:hypothetical protein [Pallidibacillus thermolactis]MCU9600533.1 hypothetical protein [Pallidibacillus thermolactis subsp. kokeshiiformis]
MQKRFGIDIDGTVTSPDALVPFLNEGFKLQLTLDDITQYDLTPFVPVSREEFNQWYIENEGKIYQASPIAAGAKDVLNEWDKKHQMYFISARSKQNFEITKTWLDQHQIRYDEIILLGSHNKVQAAKEWNIDIFFEDRYENAVEIHEQCKIPVVLFDTPYNRKPLPEGVIRVQSWMEAKKWVDDWLNNN